MNELIKQVQKLRIDKDLAYKGSQIVLAEKIGVNNKLLSMALTGYRQTPGSEKILRKLFDFLKNQKGAGA
jgi:hypothetical protein